MDGTDFSNIGDVFSEIGTAFRDTFSGDYLGTEHTEEAQRQIEKLKSSILITQQLSKDGWQVDGIEVWAEVLGVAADAAEHASDEMRVFTIAVSQAMGILDKQAALDAVEAAIDNARKGFKEFGATLDENNDKGRQNRANLREIASGALEASEHLKGMAKVEYLREMAGRLANMADLLGMGKREARNWARAILGLDALEATPTVQLDDKEGRRKVRQMMIEMDLLHGKHAVPEAALLYSQFQRGKITVENMLRILDGMRPEPSVSLNTRPRI